jgi:hypothetical protein
LDSTPSANTTATTATSASTTAATTADPEGWEEPTTGQAPPTWDEEPQVSKVATEAWAESDAVEGGEEVGEGETGAEDVEEPTATMKESVLEVQSKEPEPEPPVQAQLPQQQPAAAAKPSRPAPVSHRSSVAARYKNVDSPVVMPSTIFGGAGKGVGAGALGFGGVGTSAGGAGVGALGGLGVEKVGMQFGSLSLGGDSFDSNA